MDIVDQMADKWIKELTSCVSEKGALFLDWYDAENLRDFIKAKDEEIERLREALKKICHVTGSDMEAYDIAENALKGGE